MGLKNSFSGLATNKLSRRFGSTLGGAEPYTTGYHGIWFDKIPKDLPTYVEKEACGKLEVNEIQTILSACCTGVTPPGGTLNTVEMPALGGNKWGVPGNVDYGTTVAVKFFEMNKLPIISIMHAWVKMIRDYRTGVSNIQDGSADNYSKKSYSALLYYWTTSVDGKTVQYYAAYDGVYPHKDPQDLLASDIETIGRLDVEIEFHLDYPWHEPWVKEKCQNFSDSFTAESISTIEKYGNAGS